MKKMKRTLMSVACAAALVALPSSAFADQGAYELSYNGDADEFSIAGSDLFSHAPSNLPGDVLSGTLVFKNDSDAACEVFASLKDITTTADASVLDDVSLRVIGPDDGSIIEGALGAIGETDPASLGEVGPGEEIPIAYELVIADTLGNDAEDAEVGLNMVVSVEEHPEIVDPTPIAGETYDQTGTDAIKSAGTAAGVGAASLLVLGAGGLAYRRFGVGLLGTSPEVEEAVSRARHAR